MLRLHYRTTLLGMQGATLEDADNGFLDVLEIVLIGSSQSQRMTFSAHYHAAIIIQAQRPQARSTKGVESLIT
jgi:hypothetical protein